MSDEELVAWVDENEQLIKAIPISLANSDPQYLHSEIAVLLYDKKKRILLQKRATTKRVMPGVWICSAAGHVTYGESIEVAAHRELREEIGFDVPNLVEVTKIMNTLQHERHVAHWYLGKYRGEQIVLDPHEADEYAWVSQADFSTFRTTNTVSHYTTEVSERFWVGEWSHLLK